MPLNPNDTLANGQTRLLRLLGRGGLRFGWRPARGRAPLPGAATRDAPASFSGAEDQDADALVEEEESDGG